MKHNKKLFIFIEAVLAIIVISLAFIMLRENSSKDLRRVSVVVQGSDGRQWAAFRYGLEMAANDYGTEMVFANTSDNLTAEEEVEVIKREIQNGADAVIVQPVPGDGIEGMLREIDNKIPVMLAGCTASVNREESLLPVTEPDNYSMGRTLAEELLSDYNGNIEGKTLGIASENASQEAVINRMDGVLDVLEGEGAKVCWSVSGSLEETGENPLDKQQSVDIVVALDDRSLVTACSFSAANNLHGALVYGTGHSTEALYYLDTGIVECLVVPDEFNKGYKSLAEASKSAKYFFRKMSDQKISYKVIRRDELFLPQNQEILFTMNQ
ncbi:MAG: substrate-binding domain-containing protein [Lachnospiraceae bacterium]|nr:substrate-binding domain-containing protein [Lachnospiraceae bacterium]